MAEPEVQSALDPEGDKKSDGGKDEEAESKDAGSEAVEGGGQGGGEREATRPDVVEGGNQDDDGESKDAGPGGGEMEKEGGQNGNDAEVEGEKAGGGGEGTAAVVEVSPLEEKVIRQVEFYFGDRNLSKDKFLQQAIQSNDDGWVPVATLLTFNRLKALSSDKDYIVTALKKTSKKIVEVSSDGDSIRRHPENPLPDIMSPDQRKQIRGKSIYAKGFDPDTRLDAIQEFFDQYGKTQFIQMRRTGPPDKKFKGSVFVEFEDKGDAEKFLSLDTVKFRDTELIKESKEAYFKRKQDERRTAKQQQQQQQQDHWREEEVKRKEEERKKPCKIDALGCVLHFKGCGPDTTWEQLKEVFQEFATVAFIDFSKGNTEGYVRFQEENGAQRALEAMAVEEGKPQLFGQDTDLRVLEGTEEEEYWQKMMESRQNRKSSRNFRGGKRGGYGRKRKQQRDQGGEGPATKHPKED